MEYSISKGTYMSHLSRMPFVFLWSIIRIGEQRVIGHDMIFKQSLEIFLAPATEQKAIDFGAKFLESSVRWSKESSALVMGGIIQTIEKTSFHES